MSELSADLTDVSPAHPAGSLSWLILLALAVGGFGIGTGEFVIMGLMPTIAADLGVTEPQVGHVISSYALGVVVGAPILAIFGARLYRRHLLLLLMVFFALGNLASALAPDYHSLLLARFVAGLPHGAYFGVAALVAGGMSPSAALRSLTSDAARMFALDHRIGFLRAGLDADVLLLDGSPLDMSSTIQRVWVNGEEIR